MSQCEEDGGKCWHQDDENDIHQMVDSSRLVIPDEDFMAVFTGATPVPRETELVGNLDEIDERLSAWNTPAQNLDIRAALGHSNRPNGEYPTC